MADHNEHKEEIGEEKESLMDKIVDKLHLPHNHHESAAAHDDHDETSTLSSSSSDDEADKTAPIIPPAVPVKEEEPSSAKAKVNRLFGREKPVHQVLGGGKTADVFLWRDKKVSASVLGTATVIWVLFELLEYHLLALICHISIFTLAGVFLWANASTLLHKTEPKIPEVHLPERALVDFASAVTFELNRGLALLRDIASGKELKKFLAVIAGLWLLSVLGSSCNFLTLFYIAFVVLHTLPALYEKHEDKVDSYAERAAGEVKRQYSLVNEKYLSKVNEKYLSKIPKVSLKDKKTA